MFGLHIWKYQLCSPSIAVLNSKTAGAQWFVLLALELQASWGSKCSLGRQCSCTPMSSGESQVPQPQKSGVGALPKFQRCLSGARA